MTPAGPRFSLIVPTYRRRESLARCLAAIASLSYPRERFEVLVVDDGSPTPPTDLMAALDPAIDARLICASHGGPAAARNTGARYARGQYLAFTDDDCAPERDWLAAVDRHIGTTTEPVAFGGRTVNALTDNLFAAASQGIIDFLYGYYEEYPAGGRFFATNNLVIPRAEFLELGGFDEGFRLAAAEDRDLCERWRSRGLRLDYAADAVVRHAHPLGLASFTRQHFAYGRGAFDLHRSRARRGRQSLRLEPPRFYRKLVLHPLRERRDARAAALSLLHLWSQVAYAAGYFFERARRGWAVGRAEGAQRRESEPRVFERSEIESRSDQSKIGSPV